MEKLKAFFAWLGAWISSGNETPKLVPVPKELKRIAFGSSGELVTYAETLLAAKGVLKRSPTGVFDTEMEDAVRAFQKMKGLTNDGVIGTSQTWPALTKVATVTPTEPLPPKLETGMPVVNPAYQQAQKYVGKTEFDKDFQAKIVPYWKRVGLATYKYIVGATFAWCSVFVVMAQIDAGQGTKEKVVYSAGAKDQGRSGYDINFKVDGIPESAVYHINHGGKCPGCTAKQRFEKNKAACKSGSGNHTGFTAADCSAKDLFETFKDSDGTYKVVAKSGAVFKSLSGNSNNMVQYSYYDANELCEVRWHEPKTPIILTSVNCSGKATGGSTR